AWPSWPIWSLLARSPLKTGKPTRTTSQRTVLPAGRYFFHSSFFLITTPDHPPFHDGKLPTPMSKGEPVNIGVGYFPSWNGGWPGAVIKQQEPCMEYLPAGRTRRGGGVRVGLPRPTGR